MPKKTDFINLHVHSEYSILDGAIRIRDLVDKTKKNGMNAVALTDHGNLFGSYEFYRACRESGIKPIIGEEFYLARHSRFDKEKSPFHLILLAKNKKGFENLSKLSSIAFTEGFYYKPRIDREVLEKYHDDLIALTACIQGEVPSLFLNGYEGKAVEAAKWYRELFGDDFYLEVQNHGMEEERRVINFFLDLSKKLNVDIVATNDSHYLNKEDWEAHDALLCLQTGKKIADKERMRFPSHEFYLKTGDEMLETFREIPFAVSNTVKVAEKVEDIEIGSSGYLLPRYEVPENYTFASYLRELAENGLKNRFGQRGIRDGELKQRYTDRLNYELGVIEQMGFPAYFLIVWDFINWAKKNGIPVGPGRGSAAGSLVAYAVGITEIDPIRFNLLFERFLNPERVNMPDIDVDICQEGRKRVIQYVRDKYGSDRVCQIVTFGKMKTKMVIRDVGRVLGIPPKEVNKFAKNIPDDAQSIEEVLSKAPEIKSLSEKDELTKRWLTIASKLQGLTRQVGIHAAGVVIAPDTLTKYIPVARSKDGEVITQYDMSQVEKLGLLKMDFLGLKTLTIVDSAVKLIESRTGKNLDIFNIPLDDEDTFKLLQNGNTVGVFQLESPGMRNLVRKLKPSVFGDIIALVALYRPGPLSSGMADSFIKRKHGLEKVEYEFPELEPYLKETYGLFIYQEQIMQIANVIAGYSLGEADLLRRAMGKKKREIMDENRSDFVNRAVEKGYPREKVEKLFNNITKFAEYGFNKSHSAAYAFIAYVTAYLKAHYPKEFLTSIASIDYDDTDEMVKYITDARKNGIEFLSPDVNKSDALFSIEDKGIRFGLAGIKGVGEKAASHIVKMRKQKGNFEDVYDFCEKIDLRQVNKRVVESLVKAGAFDSTGIPRSVSFDVVDNAMSVAHSLQKSKDSGQLSLFGSDKMAGITKKEFPNLSEWENRTKLEYERQAIGFYLSGHPLLAYKDIIALKFNSISEKEEWKDGQEVKLIGAVTKLKRRRSQKGELWANVDILDLEGIASVLIFPDVYKGVTDIVTEGNVIVIEGFVRQEENIRTVIAKSVKEVNAELSNSVNQLVVKLSEDELNEDFLGKFRDYILKYKGERDLKPVVLDLKLSDCTVKIQTHPNYSLPLRPEVISELETIIPKERIEVE